MTGTPECIWDLKAQLGEGPLWWNGALWFVNIKGPSIHRFDPTTGEKKSWDAPARVGFVQPMRDGLFLAGLKTGLHRFDPATGSFNLITAVHPEHPDNRLNDSTVDAQGRLWFGSMDDAEEQASGKLYRFDGTLSVHDQGYVVTNGPVCSPDASRFYHTDTLGKTVYVFDVDAAGNLSNKRALIHIEDGAGYPDGTVVDAEGCLWIGLFFGGAVRRYSPQGALLASIALPCSNVTKVAFGGPDLKTVYVTTAWAALDEAQRAAQPLAGGLFRFSSDVPGLPAHALRF